MKNSSSSGSKQKRGSGLKSTGIPYASIKLNNSNSFAYFMARSKDKYSLKNRANGLSQSLCKISTPSKQKRIRASKSCIKGCKVTSNEIGKFNTIICHDRLSSIHITEKKNIQRELTSSSKKIKSNKSKDDAVTTLNRISDALQRIKKSKHMLNEYNSTIPSQKKAASNRKLLNNSNIQTQHTKIDRKPCYNVNRKHSNEIVGHNREFESSELDSAAVITDTTITGKRIEESTKYIEYKKAIINNLTNCLKAVDKNKGKDDPLEILDKKFLIINEAFNGVINIDNKFRPILKGIQTKFQDVHSDYGKQYKLLKEKHNSEILKTKNELSKQKAKITSIKSEQEKLLKEKSELIKRHEKTIKELREMDLEIKKQKNDEIIELLKQENNKLLNNQLIKV